MFITYVFVLIVMVLGGNTMILDFQFFFFVQYRLVLFDGSKIGICDEGLELKRILL